MQANQRLDAQYKELEAFQREAAVQKSRETPTKSISVNGTSTRASARRSLGTRVSRRLRGAEEDEEEWQEIPEEWLKEKGSEQEAVKGKRSVNGKEKAKPVGRARALRILVEDAVDEMEEDETQEDQVNDQVNDSMSELTELSELTPEPDEELEMKAKTKAKAKGRAPPKGRARGKAKGKAKTLVHPPVKEEIVEEEPDPEPEPEPEPPIPADFIEWEAVCVPRSHVVCGVPLIYCRLADCHHLGRVGACRRSICKGDALSRESSLQDAFSSARSCCDCRLAGECLVLHSFVVIFPFSISVTPVLFELSTKLLRRSRVMQVLRLLVPLCSHLFFRKSNGNERLRRPSRTANGLLVLRSRKARRNKQWPWRNSRLKRPRKWRDRGGPRHG